MVKLTIMSPILKLYLETSLFGFYHDESERNSGKRESVHTLFQQVKSGFFQGYVSPVTIGEISRSPEPLRNRDLKLIEEFGFLPLNLDSDQVAKLQQMYLKSGVLGEDNQADLLHIAAATLSFVNVLVSYNFAHIINERTIRLVKSVNLREGYRTEFSVLPPEGVVIYEK